MPAGSSTGVWESSDEALLAGYATGDRDASTVFVQRFQSKAHGLALLITGDRADADEVAQEAFLRAWRYAASYDPRRGSVSGWLLGIVRNAALDRVRLSARGPMLFGELPAGAVVEETLDASDAIGERDEARPVLAALGALPEEQRQTLLAVALHGLSAREVSERTNVPLGTVKTRIRLALRKLRDQLEAPSL